MFRLALWAVYIFTVIRPSSQDSSTQTEGAIMHVYRNCRLGFLRTKLQNKMQNGRQPWPMDTGTHPLNIVRLGNCFIGENHFLKIIFFFGEEVSLGRVYFGLKQSHIDIFCLSTEVGSCDCFFNYLFILSCQNRKKRIYKLKSIIPYNYFVNFFFLYCSILVSFFCSFLIMKIMILNFFTWQKTNIVIII